MGKTLDFLSSDPDQPVRYGSLPHSVQEVASFLMFFKFLKFHLKSLDLSLFLEGGGGLGMTTLSLFKYVTFG